MVARSLASTSDISVLIDPETILLSNFLSTLKHAHKLDEDWLLIASSKSISRFPFLLDSDGKSWRADDGKHVKIQKVGKSLIHITARSGMRDLILKLSSSLSCRSF